MIDESKDDDTYHTEFKMLSDLCQSHNMNPIDVLGLALATDNEIVKNERTFRSTSNPFDYTESDRTTVYSSTKYHNDSRIRLYKNSTIYIYNIA